MFTAQGSPGFRNAVHSAAVGVTALMFDNRNLFERRLWERNRRRKAAIKGLALGAMQGDLRLFYESSSEASSHYDARRVALRLLRRTDQAVHPVVQTYFAENWGHMADKWRSSINDDRLLLDTLRLLLPPYTGPAIVVYRGDASARERDGTYGFCWSGDKEVARQHAKFDFWRGCEGGSVLVEAYAPAEAVIHLLGDRTEEEYVIDRRRLRDIRVLERFSS
jgi:hypothetical protein